MDFAEQITNIVGGERDSEAMVLTVIHKYLKATGMPPTKFGRGVANDPRLVGDMARGRVPGPDMVARIKAFIAAHPKGGA